MTKRNGYKTLGATDPFSLMFCSGTHENTCGFGLRCFSYSDAKHTKLTENATRSHVISTTQSDFLKNFN